MRKSENPEVHTLEQKLKAAKERRCNMLFDSLSPNFNDVIYISEIDSQLRYMHPNTMHCLQAFFQSFCLQTKRNFMNRKYFTLNILTALEKHKFDLHLIFQDPDIVELEKRISLMKFGYYERDKTFSKNVQESSSKETEESQNKLQLYKLDLPLQRPQDKKLNNSKNTENSASAMIKTDPNNRSQERENLIEAHNSQRENHRKLKEYLSKHFRIDVVEAASVLEKEGSNTSIQGIAQINIPSHAQPRPTAADVVRRLSTSISKNRNVQTSEEVAFEKCTFEPKLYKPLKSVINKPVDSKVYNFLQKNKYIKEIKNISYQYEKTPQRANKHDSPQKYSGLDKSENNNCSIYFSGKRQKENIEIEEKLDASTFDLGYKNMHVRKLDYAEHHLIPEYIELTTRRASPDKQKKSGLRNSSHSRNLSVSKSPLRSKSSSTNILKNSVHEPQEDWNHGLLSKEAVRDISPYLEVRKKYYSYLSKHQERNLESKVRPSSNAPKNKAQNTNLKGVIFSGGDVYTKKAENSFENNMPLYRVSKSRVNTRERTSPSPSRKGKLQNPQRESGKKQHKRGNLSSVHQSVPNTNQAGFVSFGPKHYLQRITAQKNVFGKEDNQSFSFTEREMSQM